MAGDLLNVEEAPFSNSTWQKINGIAVEAASSQLAGRRILEIEGPYGLGAKSIPGSDRAVGEPISIGDQTAELLFSPITPMAAIQSKFAIPIRDVATFEETGIEFGAIDVTSAAIAVANQEDTIIFHGSKDLGLEGLTTLKSAQSFKLSSWDEVGASINDIIEAVGLLDKAGFPGPYAMALAPNRYNLLFRRFMQGNLSEFDLLKEIVPDGIVKAPILKTGGVLLAAGKEFASIAIGQDLATIFSGPVGAFYEFTLIESLALRVRYPGAICILK